MKKPTYSTFEVLLFIERLKDDIDFLYQLNYLVLLESERYSKCHNKVIANRLKSKLDKLIK